MPSSARTSLPLAAGGAGIPLGMKRVSCGRMPSTSIMRRWSSRETATNADDQRAITRPVGEPAQRLALVGPGVLVGDDHGHAGEAADDRAPQVRAELVGVQHVHALPAQEPVQRPPRPHLAGGGALQADHAYVGGAQVRERVCDVLLRDRDIEVTARDQRAVEALRVEPRGGLDREALGAARAEPVDERHDPQLAGRGRRRKTCGEYHARAPGGRCVPEVLHRCSDDRTPEPHRRPSRHRRRPCWRPPRAQLPGLLLEREELRAARRHPVRPRGRARLLHRPAREGRGAGVAACIAGTARGPALGASAPVGPGRVRALPRRRGRAVAAQRDGRGASTRSRSRCAAAPATACGSTACPTRRRSSCRPGGPRRWRRARARACSRGCTSRPARSAGPTPRGAPCAAMRLPSGEGGVQARLGGGPWPEEYPTDPPSYVLNGGIFALWGMYDVGAGLGDEDAARDFEQGATCWRRTCTAGTPATGRATTCSRIRS